MLFLDLKCSIIEIMMIMRSNNDISLEMQQVLHMSLQYKKSDKMGHEITFGFLYLNRELKQPRHRRQQKPHKFAYLTMKISIFARFALAFLIF